MLSVVARVCSMSHTCTSHVGRHSKSSLIDSPRCGVANNLSQPVVRKTSADPTSAWPLRDLCKITLVSQETPAEKGAYIESIDLGTGQIIIIPQTKEK